MDQTIGPSSLLLSEPVRGTPLRWVVSLGAAGAVAFVLFLLTVQSRVRVERAMPITVELGYLERPVQPPKPAVAPKRAVPPPPPTRVVEETDAPVVPNDLVVPTTRIEEDAPPTAPPSTASPPVARGAPEGPLRLETGVRLDNVSFDPIFTPKPAYPAVARSAGIEGFVDVDLLISEEGRVEQFSLTSISGHPSFGNEVAKVIARWRFPPPRHGGRSVKVKYLYRVKFEMQ